MHRLLGSVLPALLLATVLTACGDETASDSAGDEPSTEPSVTMSSPGGTGGVDQPSDSGDGTVDFELVDTITVTDAGGALSETAVPLPDAASVDAFTAQFENDGMVEQVRDAVAGVEVPDGRALYAAVISIGCDAPTEVMVTESASGLVVTAGKVPSPQLECFAPMTTVALVLAAA